MQIEPSARPAPAAATMPGQTLSRQSIPASPDAGPVELIELGLALELLLETHPVFADAVKAAILPFQGDFLFELPHGDGGKGRIAAVRLAYAGQTKPQLAYAVLGRDGLETRIEPAGSQDGHLESFAEAFIAVLEKIGAH